MDTSNTDKTRLSAPSKVNTGEQSKSDLNLKNAHKTHTRTAGPSRGDVRYWLAKVKKLRSSPDYSVQIEFQKRRVRFPLRTPNKAAAAAKALGIYQSILAHGWDDALATLKPTSIKPVRTATVGELIAEVKATTSYRTTTWHCYAQGLRQIAAEIAGIGDQPERDEQGNPKRDKKKRILYRSRLDYRTGGRDAWLAQVDNVSLDTLTGEAVNRWSMAHVAKAGTALDAQRRARNRANSVIRNARALFSEKALTFAKGKLILPNPLPFAGIRLEKGGSTRYLSKINAPALIAQARDELTGEPLKIFCLGLFCGLRRNEIDKLTWAQVDFAAAQIRIEATPHFQPKTEDSIDTVDLENELLAKLSQWRAESVGEFVVGSTREPRHGPGGIIYRCERSFDVLNLWLRSKGITARKPLHELRKELGAILASKDGIYAAQSGLRHKYITQTSATYASQKRRITSGMGNLLADKPAPLELVQSPVTQPVDTITKRKAQA